MNLFYNTNILYAKGGNNVGKHIYRQILNKILVVNNANIDEIINELSITREEFTTSINNINKQLNTGHICLNKNNVYLDDVSYDACLDLLIGEFEVDDNLFRIQLRQKLLLLLITIPNKLYTLQDFADLLFVSRNTIYSDIKNVKSILPDNLILRYSRSTGYFIEGLEISILSMIVDYVTFLTKFNEGRRLLHELFMINDDEIECFSKLLNDIERNGEIKLIDEKLTSLPYVLKMVIERFTINKDEKEILKFDWGIQEKINFEPVKNILNNYVYLSKQELDYLTFLIFSSNLTSLNINTRIVNLIDSYVFEFLSLLEKRLSVNFLNIESLKAAIIQHLIPAIFRQKLDIKLKNPLVQYFSNHHKLIFEAVEETIHPIEELMDIYFTEEELTYISMIILGWMYKDTQSTNYLFNAVVLCSNGTSISKYLLEMLKDIFPKINFVGAYSFRQYEKKSEKVDIIFSTKPYSADVPSVVITSVLDEKNKKKIVEEVNYILYKNKNAYAKKLTDSISSFLEKDDLKEVEDKLLETLEMSNNDLDYTNEELEILISPENLSIVNKQILWKDALDVSFASMIRRGSITRGYVSKAKNQFYRDYDYMVIGPNVYLPHTNPIHGVRRWDYQVVYFSEGVQTPNNKTANIFVALAPGTFNEHIPLIVRLNEIFTNKNNIVKIKKLNNIQDFQKIMNETL